MKKYSYKESGVEWLGKIPSHWSTDRIKDKTISLVGGDWGNDPESSAEGIDTAVLRVADLDGLFFDLSDPTMRKIKESSLNSRKITNRSILIEKSGGGEKQLVGRVGYPKGIKYDAICSNFMANITLDNSVDRMFINYTFSVLYASKLNFPFVQQTTGIQNLNVGYYLTRNISLPPLQEQKAIAEYLETVTAKIDRIIAIKKEQLVKMGEYYDSQIHEYITKGVNEKEFIESGISWQGEVPIDWKREKLFRLADKMGSGGTPTSTDQDYYDGDISWIQSGDLNDWIVSKTKKTITEEALNNSSAKMFKKGTLLIAMYGATIGKLGVMGMDSATNQACCAIQVGSRLNSDFLFYLLYDMRKFLISQGYGGGQQNISQETLKQQYFYYPGKKEQIKIVNMIKDFRSKQEKIKLSVKSQIKTLKSYRKSLIHECVTGKKQVVDYQSKISNINIYAK